MGRGHSGEQDEGEYSAQGVAGSPVREASLLCFSFLPASFQALFCLLFGLCFTRSIPCFTAYLLLTLSTFWTRVQMNDSYVPADPCFHRQPRRRVYLSSLTIATVLSPLSPPRGLVFRSFDSLGSV